MRNAYGIVCLALGGLLIAAQLYGSWRQSRHSGTTEQARQVAAAATKVQEAADRVTTAATTLQSSAYVSRGSGESVVGSEALEAADQEASTAKEDATAAKEQVAAASGTNQWDLLGTLAGKVPLVVAGVVVIALGAFIMGWVELSASAGGDS